MSSLRAPESTADINTEQRSLNLRFSTRESSCFDPVKIVPMQTLERTFAVRGGHVVTVVSVSSAAR